MEQLLMSPFSGLAMINFETMILVAIVILVLFGGTKIPQLMRGVGKGISEFQEGIKEGKNTIRSSVEESKAD